MKQRLLFLYTSSWSKETADYEAGKVPAHRLFGYADVRKLGHEAAICDPPNSAGLKRLVGRPILWRVYQAWFAVRHRRSTDCIVATHEAAALPVLLLKRFGLLKTPIVVHSVALLHPKNCNGKKRRLWRWLLPHAEAIVSYASTQLPWLEAEFSLKPQRLFFIPLGVDTQFFALENVDRGDYCLSVGTNDGKDFPTLIKAIPAATRLIVVTDGHNESIIKSCVDPSQSIEVLRDVSIDRLRVLYLHAAVHVIPIRDMKFSSGQTVLLENMALGRTVIVSDVPAVRDYVDGGRTVMLVPPGDVDALRNCLSEVLANPEKFNALGRNAAEAVNNCFSSRESAVQLIALVEKLVGTSS